MSAITKTGQEIAEYFGKVGKRAERVSAMDAAQRANPPRWMDTERSRRAIEQFQLRDAELGLRRQGPEESIDNILKERMDQDAQAELDKIVGYDSSMPTDMAPNVDDLGLPPEPELIKELSTPPGTYTEGYIDRVNDLQASRTEMIGVTARARKRASVPESVKVANLSRLDPAGRGMGFYDDGPMRTIQQIANKNGRLGSYVAGIQVDVAADLLHLAKRGTEAPKVPGQFLGTEPIVLHVTESDGVLKVLDAEGPASMAFNKTPEYLRTDYIPVILKNAGGGEFANAPRLIVWDDGGIRRTFPAPAMRDYINTQKFDDPMDPAWFTQQPASPVEVENALTTMFSPKGLTIFGRIVNRIRTLREGANHAWDIQKDIRKFVHNSDQWSTEGWGAFGSKTRLKDQYQIAYKELHKDLMDEQTEMYVSAGRDPVWMERVRNFGHDSPYKMSLLGDTNKDTKDMPIIFVHTDQEFYNPELTGTTAPLAQFATPAEIGIHGGVRKQADFLLPGNHGGQTMLDEWTRTENDWRSSVASVYKKAGLTEAEQKKINEKLTEVFGAGIRKADPRYNPSGEKVDILNEWSEQFSPDQLKAMGLDEGVIDLFALPWHTTVRDAAQKFLKDWRRSSQTAFIFRGKRPLILMDLKQFSPVDVAEQLTVLPQFSKYKGELEWVMNSGQDKAAWEASVAGKSGPELESYGAREFKKAHETVIRIMEAEGFDHILYPNALEAIGLPSIITWKPEHIKYLWAPMMSRRSANPNYAVIPALSLTGQISDKENNNGN